MDLRGDLATVGAAPTPEMLTLEDAQALADAGAAYARTLGPLALGDAPGLELTTIGEEPAPELEQVPPPTEPPHDCTPRRWYHCTLNPAGPPAAAGDRLRGVRADSAARRPAGRRLGLRGAGQGWCVRPARGAPARGAAVLSGWCLTGARERGARRRRAAGAGGGAGQAVVDRADGGHPAADRRGRGRGGGQGGVQGLVGQVRRVHRHRRRLRATRHRRRRRDRRGGAAGTRDGPGQGLDEGADDGHPAADRRGRRWGGPTAGSDRPEAARSSNRASRE
jgi:hypothetical protein